MLQHILEHDPIARFLLTHSKITTTQLDSCIIDAASEGLNKNLIDKVLMRDGPRVTKGSFLRTLGQGKENLEKSIYTLVLSEYFNLLPQDFIEDIIKVGKMLVTLKESSASPEKVNEILMVLRKLGDVISYR